MAEAPSLETLTGNPPPAFIVSQSPQFLTAEGSLFQELLAIDIENSRPNMVESL
jgi:hypothetical protein